MAIKIDHKGTKEAFCSLIWSNEFFASILFGQEFQITTKTKTFDVNGTVIRVNPHFADQLFHENCVGVLAHEVLHLVLKHHIRMGNREHGLYNSACDYAINPLLLKAGFKLPGKLKNGKEFKYLIDARFNNMCVEDIYRILKKERDEKKEKEEQKKEKPQENKQDQQDNSEQSSGGQSNPEENKENEPQKDETQEESEPNKDNEDDKEKGGDDSKDDSNNNEEESEELEDEEKSNEGDSSDEEEKESENDSNGGKETEEKDYDGTEELNPNDFGQVSPAENPDEAEDNIEIQTKQAEMVCKAAGNKTLNQIIDYIKECQKEKIDWRELLMKLIGDICQKDYSFSRANRSHLGRNVILPTLHSRQFGKIVIGVDCSGSLINELQTIVAEICNGFQIMSEEKQDCEITLLYCDTQICGVETFKAGDDFKPILRGGGGTLYKPFFDYIEKEFNDEIECFMLIGDGETADIHQLNQLNPGYSVNWLLTMDAKHFNVNFGEKIKIEIV